MKQLVPDHARYKRQWRLRISGSIQLPSVHHLPSAVTFPHRHSCAHVQRALFIWMLWVLIFALPFFGSGKKQTVSANTGVGLSAQNMAWLDIPERESDPDAAEQNPSDGNPVRVGIRVVPPFVITEEDGTYSGLTIALWKHIAEELDISFEYVERDIAGLLDGVAASSDAGVSPDARTESADDTKSDAATDERGTTPLFAAASALTITAGREERVDFTHPFFVSGLGIAVPHQPTGLWQAVISIFSAEFLWVILLLILLLLFWGILVWLFERRINQDEFGGSPAEGIGSGFWWAAVTMTTVGYGDKAPKSVAGRLIGFVWMFAGIILISFFTASIASSLTVSQLDTRVSGLQDLPHVRVGALEQSATLTYLNEQRIRYRTFETISDGLRAVSEGDLDAFVHDEPIIRYYSNKDYYGEVRVLPNVFNEQYYGIALPLGSTLRNDINRVMLDFIADDEWDQLQRRYLGD